MIRGLGRRLNFPRGVAFGRPVASIALLVAAGTALAQSCDIFAGMDAYNRGDVATAYRLLAEEARTGDPEAEVNLGYLYAAILKVPCGLVLIRFFGPRGGGAGW
ncbi:hypothetical protein [Roseiarcus sp.]|uniref:hypothetical protein n=1 Tax=Roseiarcus sp. TaxID=1969460 RepID=UPI003F9E5F44